MARARNIKPSFFKNEFLAEWTLADRDGRLECRPLRIKAELFPYDNCDIVAMLGQLQARGFVVAYEAGGKKILEIPKFGEHQRCHPEERSEGLPPCEDGQAVFFPGEPGNFPANCASFLFPLSSNPLPSSAPTTPAPRARSKPADPLRWTESGWEGITDADHAEWSQAYPAADLPVELAKAHQWLKANPKKARKSNWRKWLTTTWLTRCQDRGGTHREAARPAAPPPVDQAKRRFYRADAGKQMTDAEHAAWIRDQRNGGIVSTLATATRLKEEDL
jgi:hypothetical protein